MGLLKKLMKREAVTSDAYIHAHPTYSLRVYQSLTNEKAKKDYIYDPGPRPREFAATGGLYTIFRVLIGDHLYLKRAVSECFVITEVRNIPFNPYAEGE